MSKIQAWPQIDVICKEFTMDFAHNFCFTSKHQTLISWVAKLIFGRSQLMIWHQNWSIMAKTPKKQISFDATSSIGPGEISVLPLLSWNFDVSKRVTKIVAKIHCAVASLSEMSIARIQPINLVINLLINQSLACSQKHFLLQIKVTSAPPTFWKSYSAPMRLQLSATETLWHCGKNVSKSGYFLVLSSRIFLMILN